METESITQTSFLFIKPDGLQANCWEDVNKALQKKGLNIVDTQSLWLNEEQVRELYPTRMDDEYSADLIAYLTGGPSAIVLVRGNNAINAVKEAKGKTGKHGLRGKYGSNFLYNAFHCPADEMELKRDLYVLMGIEY